MFDYCMKMPYADSIMGIWTVAVTQSVLRGLTRILYSDTINKTG